MYPLRAQSMPTVSVKTAKLAAIGPPDVVAVKFSGIAHPTNIRCCRNIHSTMSTPEEKDVHETALTQFAASGTFTPEVEEVLKWIGKTGCNWYGLLLLLHKLLWDLAR